MSDGPLFGYASNFAVVCIGVTAIFHGVLLNRVDDRIDRIEQRLDHPRTSTPGAEGMTRPVSTPRADRHRRTTPTDVTCYVASGNRTASGAWPKVGMAASNAHPFGTRLRVEGVGVVTVTDRIGHSSELDIFMADRAACLRFGRQRLAVAVLR